MVENNNLTTRHAARIVLNGSVCSACGCESDMSMWWCCRVQPSERAQRTPLEPVMVSSNVR